MSLDLSQIENLPSEATPPTLNDKTTALALWLSEVLALHSYGTWKPVATYNDPRLRKLIGRGDYQDVMGDPVRYAQVIPTGRLGFPEGGYGPTAPAYVYEVAIYFGTGTDRTDATFTSDLATANSQFRTLIGATSDTVPGVLYAADRQDEMDTDGGVVEIGLPTGVQVGTIPGPDEVLALTFSLSLA